MIRKVLSSIKKNLYLIKFSLSIFKFYNFDNVIPNVLNSKSSI